MRFLRLFNPLHVLRLEHDLARLTKSAAGLARASKSLAESVGRQATPGETVALLSRLVALEGDLATLRDGIATAALYLKSGRATEAAAILGALGVLALQPEEREAS